MTVIVGTRRAGCGRGVGESLLVAAVAHARSRGIGLWLDVVDDPGPAVALYERLGCALVGRRSADWLTPHGGALVPSEHHIGAFHTWVTEQLAR